eukprot:CAMPEP_0113461658 /NCGR_PEP_ID=MMETSP0014_2-20120614/11663_1 /TAXON_ID=2857 /ORGANISM="Nitzschia sp." /LENGTH=456 /DNA_ID=CAMNT_0000353443 /DNA_START=99 /DNA_END=1469 /DNA_ORIENTATION=+ /assembly_acc=CAM_ASM_000159
MKFITATTSLLLAAATMANAQQEISLEEKWRIVDTPTFAYEDLKFNMNFSVSEFIIADMAEATLYTDGCREDGAPLAGQTYLTLNGNAAGISTDVTGSRTNYDTYCDTNTCPIPDDGSQTEIDFYNRIVGLEFGIDPEIIATAGAFALPLSTAQRDALGDPTAMANPVYTEETVGNVTAQVRFCVRMSLTTGTSVGDQDVEVNFLETIVTLDIDLSDGFTVDSIAVAPRDRLVRTAAQSYTCEGYFCDQDEVKLSGAELAATRNQGAALRVCVIPQLDARNDGVYMRRIDSFTWTRADTASGTPLTQPAIVDRVAAPNGLTTLRCDAGDLICNFESILFASFYQTAGSVAGGGICSMQFGGNGCQLSSTSGDDASAADFGGIEAGSCTDGSANDRRLRANRYLQNEDAATAEFDLNLEINQGSTPLVDSQSSDATSSTTAATFMTVVGLASAAMLL